jgi:hypothetical protein
MISRLKRQAILCWDDFVTTDQEQYRRFRRHRYIAHEGVQALEAVEPTRTRRADFHQGPERRTALLIEAGYTIATGSALRPANNFARGAGSIYESSNPLPLRHAVSHLRHSPGKCANRARVAAMRRAIGTGERSDGEPPRVTSTFSLWAWNSVPMPLGEYVAL